jgi:hypothetical protein
MTLQQLKSIQNDSPSPELNRPVLVVFAYLNATALGIAVGSVCGLWIFAATATLLIKGGNTVGPTLSLLAQYFPGYSVTWIGAIIGFLYAFTGGFFLGYIVAAMRNTFLWTYIYRARRRAQQAVLSDLP